jgi:flagellar hook assembly protein FlgD
MFAALSNTLSEELAPTEFYLSQNYPNPFREKTFVKYCIAYRTKVLLKVYDSHGEEVEKLVDEDQNPGTYEVEFYACHSREGGNLPDEYYYYRLEAGNYKCEKQMTIQK